MESSARNEHGSSLQVSSSYSGTGAYGWVFQEMTVRSQARTDQAGIRVESSGSTQVAAPSGDHRNTH